MVGDVSATPDGKIRIHPTQIKVAHVTVKGLMKLFGLDTANVVDTKNTRGVQVDDNDIILDPTAMLPPPAMRGRISGVRVSWRRNDSDVWNGQAGRAGQAIAI